MQDETCKKSRTGGVGEEVIMHGVVEEVIMLCGMVEEVIRLRRK